ncbi:MAG: MotA/TolQ/ExbB proton channel family protein [Kiritimatiellaeota bacterium]|nr:MotA/TolQ/ExbB proton channel family protein [Kiritimatiellota bacterium]
MFKTITSLLATLVLSTTIAFAQDASAEAAAGADAAVTLAADGDTNVVDTAATIGGKVIKLDKDQLSLWKTRWKQGGNTMWFLAALSVLGLGCALERFFSMRVSHVVPEGFAPKITALWKKGDSEGVRAVCAKDKSMLARVVETMLEHGGSKDFQEIKMFAEDKAGRELRLENRKSAMLSMVATLAPLLGLFGTVVGLLEAFMTVAAVGEMGDPAILADSIAKALVTTVVGLAVAMPALFCHNIFKNRLNLYSVILEEEVSDLVNNLFIKNAK